MSTTTDVILAAGPTVVALAAIGAGIWQQRRGLKHSRELTDLSAVRSVLDEAALALQRIELPSGELLDRESREEVFEASDELEPIRARLTVRFGRSHALVRDFADTMEALGDWSRAATVLAVLQNSDRPENVSYAADQALIEAASMYRSATTAFLDAAAETAGARLP